jgi:hypothetical protein
MVVRLSVTAVGNKLAAKRDNEYFLAWFGEE